MRHIIFTENTSYDTAILIKDTAFKKDELQAQYLDQISISPDSVIGFNLKYEGKKAPVRLIKAHLANVLKACDSLGVRTLFVCDGAYFKVLTGERKADPHYGYIKDCVIDGFEHMKVILGANYQGLFYNPQVSEKIELGLKTLEEHIIGLHIEPGSNIIHSEYYPNTCVEIKAALESLHQYPELTLDIEAFGLSLDTPGIGTVAFAWDEHNGLAFACDYARAVEYMRDNKTYHGVRHLDLHRRKLLLDFLVTYQGKLTYHNANFDIKMLIFSLFMEEDFFNQAGMIKGLEVMTRDFDDTKLIAYLATNSTARNSLSLKDLAQSFAGNYAESEIKDIRRIPLDDLLRYNLVDCLSTWFVKKKYEPIMLADDQLSVYETVIRPSVKVILQMELTGMPMQATTVLDTEARLQAIVDNEYNKLHSHPIVAAYTAQMQKEAWTEKNLLLKKKVKPLSDFSDIVYNPNSNQQTGRLLHDILGLPIADLTPTGEPSVGNSSLEKILVSASDPDHIAILKSLMALGEVSIILNTFIKSFIEKGIAKSDGMTYLHGNFNLGGTVSGRLSCVAGWTPVVTPAGLTPIKDIKIGDKVWTHKEHWRTVTNTIIKGHDQMYNIILCNGDILTCTKDHKLLLSDGTWKTLREILDERIEEMGQRPNEHRQYTGVVPKHPQDANHEGHSKRARDILSQCVSRFKNTYVSRRASDHKIGQILSIENRRQESNDRSDRLRPSKMGRRMRRWLRIFNRYNRRSQGVCTSQGNAGSLGTKATTARTSGSPYRWGSIKQLFGKPSSVHKQGAQCYPSLAGQGQQRVAIQEINYLGRLKVYDITVADDASYLACGVYSHNSSGPNMQNIPSTGTVYAKDIKRCFQAPPGWLLAGADFSSLEDRISALTTRDPNKMKVYIDGYDGHCLRAHTYFGDKMTGIDPNSVASINSIKHKYPELRQDSKAPTFLLTYGGTYHGLVAQVGLDIITAKQIEDQYHVLYQASDEWVQDKLTQATKDGYVTVAFGLRVRTPILGQTLLGKKSTPYEAKAEGRTAGNALGQSYGLLNNRAGIEFQERTLNSPYALEIKPIAQIHDSMYFLIKDNYDCVEWFNRNLVECMEWQGLPEIQHPIVKLGGSVEIFWPTWADAMELDNRASQADIYAAVKNFTKG